MGFGKAYKIFVPPSLRDRVKCCKFDGEDTRSILNPKIGLHIKCEPPTRHTTLSTVWLSDTNRLWSI